MTKSDLIFDWQKTEGSFRDKIIPFMIVTVIFTVLLGVLEVHVVSPANGRSASASILRFGDDKLGRSWRLLAEEDGPFPGRLKLDSNGISEDAGGSDGAFAWNDYRSELRSIADEGSFEHEKIAPKGVRVFPTRDRPAGTEVAAPPKPAHIVRIPVLIPYDSSALAWMPDEFPFFAMPEGAEKAPATWRFAVNLREDGTVRESISLAGGDDAGQVAMEGWLHGVRFKQGSGDRWLGLRVEFLNRPDNGTDSK